MAKSNSITGSLKETYKSLPPIAQTVIVVVGLILVYMLLKRVWAQLKMLNDKNEMKGEQKAFENAGERLSYPPSEYESLALQLYRAMDGMGTDEEAIERVFNSIRNNLDFLELKKAFGLREGETLEVWLQDDLDAEDIDNINNLLKSRNIQYRI